MRRFIVVVTCVMALTVATAVAALAADSDLLGSGAVAPNNGEQPAAPVETHEVAQATTSGGGELAATGIDTPSALLIGAGLMTAGGAAVLASRRRPQR